MAQRVGSDAGVDVSEPAGAVDRRLDAQDLGAVIRDDVGLRPRMSGVEAFPAPKMIEESRRKASRSADAWR